ncbi:hypothetical protein SO802_020112 [Lithocarpus litseifolius]|uniref:argininosuccinate synthase n=1 Tax=Lithocarpus litseifolius TaxID=425828 RepID=A0AAW2CC98_9ROSI
MGCICGKPSATDSPRNSRPRKEPCFRFIRKIPFQVHFELPFFAPNPKLNVVDPWRECDIIGREYAIEYAKKHNVPIPETKKSIYSGDRNLWHLSHEGDILEDLANKPKKDMYMWTVDPEEAKDKPEYIEIGIESGLPDSVNLKELSPASLFVELNKISGKHGIGQIDMVENRLVRWYEDQLKYAELISAGRRSPYSLYRQDISSFESNHIYDQPDATRFIQLYGLPNFQ